MDDQPFQDAWINAEERYQARQEVQGVVTRVTQFGVFVQVEPGIEGIIYAFELGTGPFALAGFTPGQEIQLYVKDIDVSRRRLELSPNNDPLPGLLDQHTLPPIERRKALPDEQLWPLPQLPQLPQTPASASRPATSACSTCQRTIQSTWKFCIYCGGSLQHYCQSCGSTLPDLPDAHYCQECGKPI